VGGPAFGRWRGETVASRPARLRRLLHRRDGVRRRMGL